MNPKKILLVDDEPVNRFVLAKLLEQKGYATIEAADGMQALTHLYSDAQICCLILDLNMPQLDGYAVLGALETDPVLKHQQFRVLIASAGLEEHFHKACRDRGLSKAAVVGYLEKPFDIEVFNEQLKKLSDEDATAGAP